MCNRDVASALELFNGQFELEEVNPSGATGYILLGRHTILERPAAIKVYGCDDQDIQEPSLLAACNHDNIVQVYHAQRDPVRGNMCYFMEQCDSDLEGISIRSNTPLSTLINYLHGILSGLSYLHTLTPTIIHGDIKPSNILLKNGIAKLCDFGSAAVLKTEEVIIPAGTILSKPPEAIAVHPTYDTCSDLYQVGVVGYCLLGGSLPADLTSYLTHAQQDRLSTIADDREQATYIDSVLEQKIIGGLLLKWNSIPNLISNRIVRILRRATALAPSSRFSSAADMQIALNNCRDYLDWRMIGQTSCELAYKGQAYSLFFDNYHWVASSLSAHGNSRRILRTKDEKLLGCLQKLKSLIGAGRDT